MRIKNDLVIGANGMKIWVIGRNYPDQSNNGQGSFELEQAKMLAKRGNEVTYIACVLHPFWRIKNGGFVDFDDAPVKVITYSGFFTPHMTDPMIQFPYFPKLRNSKWEKLLGKVEESVGLPDVIHIHFPLMVLSAEVFKKYHDRGVKVVVTEHWTKVINKKLDRYETNQMIAYLDFAAAYLAVGYSLKRAIIEITGTDKEIQVVPNIVNDAFKPSKAEHEGFRFGIVGRLVPEKQMDKVIEAFADAFKGDSNTQLIIVGGGPERKHLEDLAAMLGVSQQIAFKGLLGREKTAEAVRELDCLVCFSKYETFGVPVIEAWASGIPVITTTADCITDCWDDRLGISITYTDDAALQTAMRYMKNNKEQYDHDFIADYAVDHYSEETIYNALMKIYG